MNCHIFSASLIILLSLNACNPIGPNYSKPETPVPDHWNTSLQASLNTTTPDIERWWKKFNDSTLNKLINLAESQNRNLAIAAERVEEARAQRGFARGALSPALVSSGGVSRNRSSESLPFAAPNPSKLYETGLNATDEIKRNLKIVFDDLLPKWNYRASPDMRQ